MTLEHSEFKLSNRYTFNLVFLAKLVELKTNLLIVALLFPFLVYGLSPKKDKDKKLNEVSATQTTVEIESEINEHYTKANTLRYSDRKLAIKHAETAAELSVKAGFNNHAFSCYYLLGSIQQDKRNVFQSKAAIDAFEKAAKYAEITGKRNNRLAVYVKLADEYAQTHQSDNALKYYKKYIDLEENKYEIKAQQLSMTLNETKKDLAVQEEQISTLEVEQTKTYAKLDSVSSEMLESELKLSQQELVNERMMLELSNERNKRNMLIGSVIGIGLVLAFLLFAFVQSRRSKHRLTVKNKLIEEERTKSDLLLLNILPQVVADELKEKGKTTPRHYDQVTVLFTDFKSFTKISEELGPIALVEEIDFCFRAFDEIIAKHNIEKIKTIGDAYLCVSGLPIPHPNHCSEILNAAIEIQDFMNKLIVQRKKEKKVVFTMRAGVHTGSLVAGVVGTTKFVYDVWGDTVNTAARMEQHCDEGRINVSAEVFELTKKEYNFTYRGKQVAKNKGALDMYFLDSKI
ncbi:MAG: adenylate cyclase [Bacteroidia bacterium]|jgi:adenylate cyclase